MPRTTTTTAAGYGDSHCPECGSSLIEVGLPREPGQRYAQTYGVALFGLDERSGRPNYHNHEAAYNVAARHCRSCGLQFLIVISREEPDDDSEESSD